MTRVWGNALALCGALVLIAAASAQADTRYAAPGGTGPGVSCPQAAPCSLVDALSDTWVDNGDSVLLAPGDYDRGGAPAFFIENAIDVGPAQPGTWPRILNDGDQALMVVDDATITGIRIEAANIPFSGYSVVSVQDGPLVRLERVVVSSPSAPDAQAVGVHDGGVELVDSAVFVEGANSEGVEFYSQPRDSAIVNSTVIAAGAGSAALAMTSPFPGQPAYSVEVRNTIARGVASGLETSDASAGNGEDATIDFAHSNLGVVDDTPGDDAFVNLGAGMQSQPPLLTNPPAGDFAQLPGSPTIDAGLADPLSGPFDLLGNPRTQGAAVDIGAVEYPSPPAVDAQAPVTTITKGPKRKQKTSKRRAKAKFEFASSEPGSSFACKLDKTGWKPCASPYVTKVKAKFKAKEHVLAVRATDAAGNTEPEPAEYRWKLKRKR
jgi:hypothetical protein